MDKFAQKRSLRSRVWETANLSGKALEYRNDEFAAIMQKMRDVDKEIRDIAADVRPLIRFAKSNVRQRDYLNAAHQITGFHARVRTIAHILEQFYKNIEIGNYDYFLSDFEGPEQEELFQYDPDAAIKEACEEFDALVKEAGILDWTKEKFLSGKDIVTDTAANILTGKGLSRRLLEKRFNTDFVKKIKNLTTNLVQKSDKMLRDLLSIFSELESGVSRRNSTLYIAKSKDFVAKFKAYHKVYTHYRAEVIEPLKQHKAAKAAQALQEQQQKQQDYNTRTPQTYDDFNIKQVEENDRYEQSIKEKTPPTPPTPFVAPPLPGQPVVPKNQINELSFEEWKKQQPKPPENEEKTKKLDEFEKTQGPVDEFTTMDLPHPVTKKTHMAFLDQISIYANQNNSSLFVNELLKYSAQLEDTNSEASAKLLTIAHNVINNYKTAGIFDFLKSKPAVTSPAEEVELGKTPPTGTPQVQQPMRSGLQYVAPKPQELVEERQNFLRPPTLDLPEGRIDRSYTDLGLLRAITPDKMRITPETTRTVIKDFATRLGIVQRFTSLEPYIESIEQNLIPLMKQAIYNGWVTHSDPVMDEFNPRDKSIEIYTRINLADINTYLSGVAKLHIKCRVSATKGMLTIRSIKRQFGIEAAKIPQTDEELEQPEGVGDEDFSDQIDQYNED